MSSKLRLDELLVRRGLFRSRSKAAEAVRSGKVQVDGKAIDKPGKKFLEDAHLQLIEHKFVVSRAYYKLKKALESFQVVVEGTRVCDLGASTGGFTQLLLERGASVVYAVDVGTAQLDPVLKNKPEVISLENTDARSVTRELLNGAVDIVTADLSFISVTKVVDSISEILKMGGHCICLIKPQFEAGPGLSKKGVILNASVHKSVLHGVIDSFHRTGLVVRGMTFSPLRGKNGNIEYLIHAVKGDRNEVWNLDIGNCVNRAFETLALER